MSSTKIVQRDWTTTFLLALGYNMGKSLVENDCKEIAISTITKAKNYNCNIILPSDVVCGHIAHV